MVRWCGWREESGVVYIPLFSQTPRPIEQSPARIVRLLQLRLRLVAPHAHRANMLVEGI